MKDTKDCGTLEIFPATRRGRPPGKKRPRSGAERQKAFRDRMRKQDAKQLLLTGEERADIAAALILMADSDVSDMDSRNRLLVLADRVATRRT